MSLRPVAPEPAEPYAPDSVLRGLVTTLVLIAAFAFAARVPSRSRRQPRFAEVMLVWLLTVWALGSAVYDLIWGGRPAWFAVELVLGVLGTLLGLSVYRSLPPAPQKKPEARS